MICGHDANATMQILTDYDSQLGHLRKELDMIKKEFETWAENEKPSSGTAQR